MSAIGKRLGAAALAFLGVLLLPGAALAAAGKVIFVSGEATLVRGGTVTVERGMDVQSGDTFVTGADGRVQLLMADGERIALRPGTRFSIDEFSGPPGGAAGQPSAWRSFYSLVRGGFNTLTHSLGARDENSYRVKTPVATIGIRGTYFAAVLCQGGSCNAYGGGNAHDGLYVGVSDGAISLRNNGGSLIVGNDEYALVEDSDSSPKQLDKPPGFLNSTPPAEGEGNFEEQVSEGEESGEDFSTRRSPDEGTTEEGGSTEAAEGTAPDASTDSTTSTDNSGSTFAPDATPPQEITATDPSTGGTVDLTDGGSTPATPPPAALQGVAFAGPGATSGAAISDSSQYGFGAGGALTAFDAADGRHDVGTASNVNGGFDPTTGLRWGRWAGGTASVTPSSGSPTSVDLTNASQHWIYGPESADVPVLPQSGTATYTLVGNTDPTDNHGNTGFVGSANLSADFTNQTVHSDVSVGGFGAQPWSASGNGSIQSGTATFGGNYSCTSGCASGNFAGFFTDNAAGAGMGYSLQDGQGTSVSGTAAFRKN